MKFEVLARAAHASWLRQLHRGFRPRFRPRRRRGRRGGRRRIRGGTSSRRSLSFDVVSSLWNCRRFVAVHKCRSLSFDVVPSLWNCRRFDAVHKCHMLWSVLKWLPSLSLFRGTDFVTAYACQPIGLMVLALLSLFQRADFVTASLCLGLGLDLF